MVIWFLLFLVMVLVTNRISLLSISPLPLLPPNECKTFFVWNATLLTYFLLFVSHRPTEKSLYSMSDKLEGTRKTKYVHLFCTPPCIIIPMQTSVFPESKFLQTLLSSRLSLLKSMTPLKVLLPLAQRQRENRPPGPWHAFRVLSSFQVRIVTLPLRRVNLQRVKTVECPGPWFFPSSSEHSPDLLLSPQVLSQIQSFIWT